MDIFNQDYRVINHDGLPIHTYARFNFSYVKETINYLLSAPIIVLMRGR